MLGVRRCACEEVLTEVRRGEESERVDVEWR